MIFFDELGKNLFFTCGEAVRSISYNFQSEEEEEEEEEEHFVKSHFLTNKDTMKLWLHM